MYEVKRVVAAFGGEVVELPEADIEFDFQQGELGPSLSPEGHLSEAGTPGTLNLAGELAYTLDFAAFTFCKTSIYNSHKSTGRGYISSNRQKKNSQWRPKKRLPSIT
jgi:hypothetical protein